MMKLLLFLPLLISVVIGSKEIDPKYLKCLVCRSTINELQSALAKIDPSREIEIGNYRMDAQGNTLHKKVPLARSEVEISDMLDNICEKMSDYVRATYKSNGQLTILNLMSPSGEMNPELSKVDIIQDNDLNKSLKYYCEGIVEEFEDDIISLFTRGEGDARRKVCTDVTQLCNIEDFVNEDNVDFTEQDEEEEKDEL